MHRLNKTLGHVSSSLQPSPASSTPTCLASHLLPSSPPQPRSCCFIRQTLSSPCTLPPSPSSTCALNTLRIAGGAATPHPLSLPNLTHTSSLSSASRYSSTALSSSSSELPFPPSSPLSGSRGPWTGEVMVEHQEKSGVVVLKLNRPKSLNALSLDMILSMCEYVKQLDDDDRCTAILLMGEGDKAFCAGGDVRGLMAGAPDSNGRLCTVQRFFSREYLLDYRISILSKPYVSLWKGIVMGGGCGLSMHGRFRIATDTTLLAMPETAIGLFPDVGRPTSKHPLSFIDLDILCYFLPA
eukprot:GHVQ01004839.1.p1 GENE.GHVQ01004839.1~~GHVQ01004839.1.p1  ORF type:complete len:297 (+),score=60.14 GHVQ01004839.1:409-1299(+)